MELQNLLVEMKDGVAVITMNCPKTLNALNNTTLAEFSALMSAFQTDDTVRGVIITGAGRAFAAGADIKQMENYTAEQGRNYAANAQSVFNQIEKLEKPVIAAVNGYALGGGNELAMSCDIRIASEKAVFGQPEATLGVIPCFGGTQRLTRLVGKGIAKELIFTCRSIKADEAYRIGLVNKVVPAEELMNEAMAMMQMIVTKAPLATKYAKIAIDRGSEMDIVNGLEFEKDLCTINFGTQDFKEGVKAFLEKRPAEFKGC